MPSATRFSDWLPYLSRPCATSSETRLAATQSMTSAASRRPKVASEP